MSARLRATILGCGPSSGVPRIGNGWGACDPNEPKNRRLRCSVLLERFGKKGERPTRILVDTGPDLRAQLLAANVESIDAVVYTHAHADHVSGIDELRVVWQASNRLVDVYADDRTMDYLARAFGYCFTRPHGSLYAPFLKRHPAVAGTPFTVTGDGGPITVLPFVQVHGDTESLGLRAGRLAYSCDVSDLPTDSLSHLTELDVWIVDALRHRAHPSHFSVAEALAWISRLRPKRAILTHMHGDLDYATLKRELPPPVEPAYDGMTIDFNDFSEFRRHG